MTEEYELIEKWAPIAGRWEFPSPVEPVYIKPHQVNVPFGICVSNIRFSEGDAKVTVTLHKSDDKTTSMSEGRILFGYRSTNDPYISIGLGGFGFAYSIAQSDRARGWRAVSVAGSYDNLVMGHPYEISVHVRGQRLMLEVDGVQVLDHVLDTPLPQGQLGLFTWGTDKVEFKNTYVRREPGTAFVVMQFSDPYQTLYADVIKPVIESLQTSCISCRRSIRSWHHTRRHYSRHRGS